MFGSKTVLASGPPLSLTHHCRIPRATRLSLRREDRDRDRSKGHLGTRSPSVPPATSLPAARKCDIQPTAYLFSSAAGGSWWPLNMEKL